MEKDYKEKIRKLLRLAQSTNEHEAKAALLKARELMAEHKLSEEELEDAGKQCVRTILTNITYSKRREPYICDLTTIIGNHYCCQVYMSHYPKKQTYIVGIIGLEEDAAICESVINYAVSFVKTQVKRIKAENQDAYYPKYVKYMCDSYGYGFTYGLKDAYDTQDGEKNWGLVMAIPPEVQEETADFYDMNFHSEAEQHIFVDEYQNGYKDGKEFDPNRVIEEKTGTEE